jgi:hypothetical protein
VAEVHETSVNPLAPPAAFGLGTTDHAVPFQRSMRVNASRDPTAKQFDPVVQATPDRPPVGGLGGLGLATMFHAGAAAAGDANTVTMLATVAHTTSKTHCDRRTGPPVRGTRIHL